MALHITVYHILFTATHVVIRTYYIRMRVFYKLMYIANIKDSPDLNITKNVEPEFKKKSSPSSRNKFKYASFIK